MTHRFAAVLFDLDGTLIDSAPDLAGAGNDVRIARGLPALPFERFRPMVGAGARGMLGVALDAAPADAGYEQLRDEFLAVYEGRLLRETHVFAAMQPVLDALESSGLRWGIVTNKVARYTLPVVRGLGLAERAGALVCGDTTPHAKPHPAPLLEAARQLALAPEACVYVGDDLRDVQAGRAAGMATLAAAWGYLGEAEPIERWGADAVLAEPLELLNWLGLD
jgi:2-phosphoglycolate phosphatase